jgi:hypothetical protein
MMRVPALLAMAACVAAVAMPASAVELSGAIRSATGTLPPGLEVVAESPDGIPDVHGRIDGDRYRIEVPDAGRVRLRLLAPDWKAPTKYVWNPKAFGALDFLVYPAKLPEPALAAELIEMGRQDQALRADFDAHKLDPVFIKRMNEEDRARERRLGAIIDAKGWPLISMVGDQAANAAWLMAQHGSAPFLERCLPLMQAAADRFEMPPDQLALSVDRVRMNAGQPQVYGSQVRWDKDGKYELYPIEDRAHVDARRIAMGMEPLSDYLAHFGL